MSNTIFLIGGGKGGVGKSLMSMAVLDFLQATGKRPFLVETDTSVPDVFKTYGESVGGELVNLDEREGWIDLVNLIESSPESTVVINTGARNQTGISNFGRTLSKALPELGRKLLVLWMIDRKRESLELLSDFTEAIPEAEVHVVRNMYLGAEKKFELQRVQDEVGDRGQGRSVAEPGRAGRSGDGRDEQASPHDRESGRRAFARRPHGAGALARRVQDDAVRGGRWVSSTTASLCSSDANRAIKRSRLSTAFGTR